jgi:serine/threonine-protein kinase
MSADNQIGKYQLVAEIAQGGMGIVYLAIAQGPGGFSKLLVVKELKPELAQDPSYLEMFFEEARLAARLNHPNISHIYEIDSDEGRHFIVMDYLDGRPLHRVMRRHDARFTLAMTLRVLCDVLEGLEYAHTLVDYDGTPIQVVHRDVTPQNVFVTFDGQIKLVDFGIATSNDSKIETGVGTLKGKPAYMPPEQVLGQADRRADLFAVGAILFEAVAGRRVWEGLSDVEIVASLIKGEIPSLDKVKPGTPPELVRICSKAMASSVNDRYQSAAAMAADLQAYAASSGQQASAREVGLLVATMFDAERQQTRAAIEVRVAAAKAGQLGAELPLLSTGHRHEGTPSGASSGSRRRRASTTTGASIQSAGGTASPVPLPEPARRAPQKTVLAVVGVLALGALALLRSPVAPVTAAASLASTAPAASPAQTAEPAPASSDAGAAAPSTATASASASAPDAGRAAPIYRYKAAATAHQTGGSEPAAATAPPAAKTDCNPPFYFSGTKKIFKPGCL